MGRRKPRTPKKVQETENTSNVLERSLTYEVDFHQQPLQNPITKRTLIPPSMHQQKTPTSLSPQEEEIVTVPACSSGDEPPRESQSKKRVILDSSCLESNEVVDVWQTLETAFMPKDSRGFIEQISLTNPLHLYQYRSDAILPEVPATLGSVGFDVKTPVSLRLKPRSTYVLKLGFSLNGRANVAFTIRPRSSMSCTHVQVALGTVGKNDFQSFI